MYCPKCGAAIVPGTAFCPICGGVLQPAAAPVQAPQPMQTPQAPQPMQTPQPAYAATPPYAYPGWDYATWSTRAIGYIVDGLLVGVGMAVLYLVVGSMLASVLHLAGGQNAAGGLCCLMILLFPLATLGVGFYNSVYLVAQRGFSIGQGLVKVKVVDASGNLLTQSTAFIRLLVRVALGFVPFLPLLDLLWPLWDERRQTLHDKAVNCYVINNPSGM
jgi:uncharacterized RDD family membrane protein YckC